MCALLTSVSAVAEEPATPGMSAGTAVPGTIHITNADIPFSDYASPEALQAALAALKTPPTPDFHGDIKAFRAYQRKYPDEQLAKMDKVYAVTITPETIGGVETRVIMPKEGIAARNRQRVLINLHGGGFMWGAESEALVESIPYAATNRIKVITVDYRMAPEYAFPAASEDVAAVYKALLKSYRPENIGIFGCSAGGILAAEAVAWFATHNLPKPGAIVSMCGTGAEFDGDSGYLAPVLAGQPPVPPGGKPLLLSALPYFKGVDAHDLLAFPIQSPKLLAAFPPTLLLAGSRDFSVSSETMMQRKLWEAGVDSQLFVFDGLWHAFMMDPTLPESREVYDIVGRFFDRHLGRKTRRARSKV
ncbi:MAG: alpha/beta fold hydrolase [Alphaproteobacteria bacterium]|nr:alpha/beta fold hydrolase [Alphaproteobacteria bacterium]MDE2493496.1 alpha/beta fold hydrolase [Alphaproteobacteria bacterium]